MASSGPTGKVSNLAWFRHKIKQGNNEDPMVPLVYEQESLDSLWCLMSNTLGDQELQPLFWLLHLSAVTADSEVGDQ